MGQEQGTRVRGPGKALYRVSHQPRLDDTSLARRGRPERRAPPAVRRTPSRAYSARRLRLSPSAGDPVSSASKKSRKWRRPLAAGAAAASRVAAFKRSMYGTTTGRVTSRTGGTWAEAEGRGRGSEQARTAACCQSRRLPARRGGAHRVDVDVVVELVDELLEGREVDVDRRVDRCEGQVRAASDATFCKKTEEEMCARGNDGSPSLMSL